MAPPLQLEVDQPLTTGSSGKLVLRATPLVTRGQNVVITYTDPTSGDDTNV